MKNLHKGARMGSVIILFHMNTFVREGMNSNHDLYPNLKKTICSTFQHSLNWLPKLSPVIDIILSSNNVSGSAQCIFLCSPWSADMLFKVCILECSQFDVLTL